MPYLKNIAFTSLIKINGRLREFNFRKRNSSLFDGNTNDERGERYFFKVEKSNDHWALVGLQLPTWLTQHESAIIEAVIKEEQINLPSPALAKK